MSSLGTSSLLLVETSLLAAGRSRGDGVVDVLAHRVQHDRDHPPCLGGADQDDPAQVALEGNRIAATDLLHLIHSDGMPGDVGDVAWIPDEAADMEHGKENCNAMRYTTRRAEP